MKPWLASPVSSNCDTTENAWNDCNLTKGFISFDGMDSLQLYEEYKRKMHRIADVRNANALLQWDQETYLPAKGAAFRGQQISTLSEISHQLFSEEELGVVLQNLLSAGDLTKEQHRNVELTFEDYTKNKKYTSAFVRALSEQTNKTFHAWIESRKKFFRCF